MTFSLENKKVWVTGHNGMVGSAIVRRLQTENCQVLTVNRQSLDLLNQSLVNSWVQDYKPDVIFLAAAKVGGIHANNEYPAEFLYQNLMIESNVIHAAHLASVKKLVFLGSSCIYPKFADQPIPEESLLTGSLEPTNEWYAIAKIAGIKLVQAYRKQYGHDWISAMPTNLYGPGDNYDLDNSHVLPAMIRKFHDAKESNMNTVKLWGDGSALREFMHSDDLADALVFLTKKYSDDGHINVGSSSEISILQLSELISKIVGFDGAIFWDTTKPNGTPRKLLNSTKIRELGWDSSRTLSQGITEVYAAYRDKRMYND